MYRKSPEKVCFLREFFNCAIIAQFRNNNKAEYFVGYIRFVTHININIAQKQLLLLSVTDDFY